MQKLSEFSKVTTKKGRVTDMAYAPKVGDMVSVKFRDHCQNHEHAPVCEVWGRLEEITAHEYKVQTWRTADLHDEDNNDHFHIVRAAVISVVKLIPDRSVE